MSKNYIISESRLRELLETEARFDALECGGVDNWDWYGASMSDFVENYRENSLVTQYLKDLETEGVCSDDFWFEDIADFELRNYKIAKGE